MTLKRIGLLGGTFNPIHNGHLHIAKKVSQHLHTDFVLFIPSGIPPHKENKKIPAAHHRMAMVRLALSEIPQFKPCDLEVDRAGPSYTIETVEALKQVYPNDPLFFIIGIDAFSQIGTWKEPKRLLTLCNFVLISRPGYPFSNLANFEVFHARDRALFHELDQGKKEKCQLKISAQTAFYFISIPHSTISATDIRKRILAGEETKNLLPQSVESYIIKNNIYKEDNNF